MKLYRVKVNGKVFEVELEAVSEVKGNVVATPAASAPVSSSTGGATIVAPIAGKVLAVKVNVGDKITQGSTIAVIEAMKMENDIQSEVDGVVEEIFVEPGDAVSIGDTLMVIK